MGILPECSRIGGGTFMVKYEKEKFCGKYDYIFGSCYKSLNNLQFWLKSRRLIGENKTSFCTLMDLK